MVITDFSSRGAGESSLFSPIGETRRGAGTVVGFRFGALGARVLFFLAGCFATVASLVVLCVGLIISKGDGMISRSDESASSLLLRGPYRFCTE